MHARRIAVKSAGAPPNSPLGPKGGSYWWRCSFEVLGVLVQQCPPKKLRWLHGVASPRKLRLLRFQADPHKRRTSRGQESVPRPYKHRTMN